ncbi:ribosomal protein L29 [Metabacillus crassostreae]|uniref:SE1832 family protein n=1 Tax=Metabacillus crassostreae TaxID=929098 RepID=UPI0019597DD0|nr:SE1832 family protein [Metabacillus crassostreae]MBM7603788.1 ribosomal protein L29 [Metabacillus crassostreae]
MSPNEINQKIDELKMEYIKVQGNIEKLESTGHSTEQLELKLNEIEEEIKKYRMTLNSK